MNKQSMWIIITIVIITALVVGGVIYAWQNSNLKSAEKSLQQQITLLQDQISQLQQVQQNKNVNQQTNQPQEIVYSNSKYQFSLKFPVTWEGYKATEPGNGGTICFFIPSSGSQPFCIFQLYILSENESIPNALKLVGQTDSWKITTDKNISCGEFNDFQCDRAKEVPEILKTFAVTE